MSGFDAVGVLPVGALPAAAEESTTVTLLTNTITITGYAPTAIGETSVQFVTQDLSLTGYIPTASTAETAAVIDSALQITPYVVTIGQERSVPLTEQDLSIVGYAVDVGQTETAQPVTQDVTISGYIVTVVGEKTASPITQDLTLTSYVPDVTATQDATAQPATQDLTITGYVPTIDASQAATAEPSTEDLSIVGYALSPLTFVPAVARVAANTATGNQDITTSNLGGLTPDAAIIIVTQASSDATHEDDAVVSIGLTDGTNAYCMQSNAEHGVATTDTHRSYSDSTIIETEIPGTSTTDGHATLVSLIANGIRINWDNAPNAAYFIHAIFLWGVDNVYAGNASLGAQDSEVDVTAPGFEPTNVISIYCKEDVNNGANTGHISLGFAKNGGNQVSVGYSSANNQSGGAPSVEQRNDYAAGIAGGEYVEISNFDSSGFSMTPRTGGGMDCAYLALDLGAAGNYVGAVDLPSSTGNDSISGIGFTPSAIIYASVLADANNTEYTDRGVFGIAFSDGTDEYSVQVCDEDTANPSNTSSWSDDSFSFQDEDGTALYTGTVSSFDTDGWTINWSAVDASGRKAIVFAMGEVPSAHLATPQTSTLSIDGETVSLGIHHEIGLTSSDVTIDGQTVTVIAEKTVAAIDSALSITGYIVTVTGTAEATAQPETQDLSITGYVVTISTTSQATAEPQTQDLSIDGETVTISSEYEATAQPSTQDLSIAGYLVTITTDTDITVEITSSDLTISGDVFTANADGDVSVEILAGSISVSLEGPFTLAVGITPDYGILEIEGGELQTNPSIYYAEPLSTQIQTLGERVRILVSDSINECKRIWKRLPDTYVLTDLVARVRFIETEYSITGYTIDLSRSVRVSTIFETGNLGITGYAATVSYPDSIIVTNPIVSDVRITGYVVNSLGEGITFDPTSGKIEIDFTLANAYTAYGETEILSAGSGSPDLLYLSASGELCTNDGTTENAIDLDWAADTNLKVIIEYGSGFMELSVYVNNVDYYTKTVAFDGTYGGAGALDVKTPADVTINDFGYQ